jgi:hypothetical protein
MTPTPEIAPELTVGQSPKTSEEFLKEYNETATLVGDKQFRLKILETDFQKQHKAFEDEIRSLYDKMNKICLDYSKQYKTEKSEISDTIDKAIA